MEIAPIKTESDYQLILMEIDRLMDAKSDTPEGDRLDVLTTLVEAFEAKHYPIGEPDLIEAILHRDLLDLRQAKNAEDNAPTIGIEELRSRLL